ncbi:hypothetical protein NLG97_g1095 [Lecanicillium saksenae]|uniref:Uncharacterized protein n=1 Tax=Lecanicillium saksenae TaxID=468837 RepID=A0ACC1R8U6_9HYPO|nr:hypothetical protein NLG97_g1095 [Lecanicillium saksenae]
MPIRHSADGEEQHHALSDRQDRIIHTSPSHPRVPSKQQGWLWSELPHIRGENQPERPHDGKNKLIRHGTSLNDDSDSGDEGEDRIDDARVDVTYDVEDYIVCSTSYRNGEEEQNGM